MRVALTADPELPVPPTHYGGIERIVDMVVHGLEDRGHDVTLFAHPESNSGGRLTAWPGRTSRAPLDLARNAAILSQAVLAGRFDLVHSFSRLAYLTPILPLSIPKLMTYQREISLRTVRLGHSLSRGSLSFTAVSQHMIRPVEHIGHWSMIPNGVRLGAYAFRPSVPDTAPLLFLGRIEKIKGPHLAVEVARRTSTRLILAGNVPNEHCAWFNTNVAPFIDGDQIRYAGPVDDAQKSQLLGASRALLMPILWEEPFGIVMVEAMACGTPVLGFDRGSVPEVIDDGVTGFVRGDLDGLVEAVTLIGGLDRLACRDRVERLYSDKMIVESYLDLYRKEIGRAATAACASA